MLHAMINRLGASFNLSFQQVMDLAIATKHSPHVRRHRHAVILQRVQLISLAFVVFTLAWIVVDALVFPREIWVVLALVRIAAAAVFALLARPRAVTSETQSAHLRLGAMLLVPPAFYIISLPLFSGVALDPVAQVFANLYGLLPFTVVAGLSVFPLTALEVSLFAVPVFGLTAYGAANMQSFTWDAYLSTLWLLLLVIGTAMLAGMTQLNYMITLVNRATKDALTGAFTRRSGEETVDLLFRVSSSQDTPLSVIFVDLDHFKSINDSYGHEEGDAALRMASQTLKDNLRRGDMLVRWGGEEFLVVMANTDCNGAHRVVERLLRSGLGQRPDGKSLTASMGVAERLDDKIDDWVHLVELADKRMYEAKKNGRDRCYLCKGEVLIGNHR